VLVLSLALAACGGHGHGSVTTGKAAAVEGGLVRPSRPIWCPASRLGLGQSQPNRPTSTSFDARTLLGEPERRAREEAAPSGCSLRVIEQDGRRLGLLDDAETHRLDVTIDFGVVTTVGVY
jgi:hypothetical protein